VRLSTRLLALIPAILIASPLMGQKIRVDSADPAFTAQGTTLNVTIRGRGFSPGAASRFLITGTADTGRVTVNSTTFISSTTLVANVTAADDAVVSLYDIDVTANGRTGKGIEKFTVQRKSQDDGLQPIVLSPPEGCDATASVLQLWRMNDGHDLPSVRFPANFDACPQAAGVPYLWVGTRWEQLDLLPGMTNGTAMDVSANGTVVGYDSCLHHCLPTEAFSKSPGLPSQFLPGTGFPSEFRIARDITSDGLHIVGGGTEGAILWSWDETLSQWVSDVLGEGDAAAVSADARVVVGNIDTPSGWEQGVLWSRTAAGEPFVTVDLGYQNIPTDVAPSGEIVVGLRWLERCTNRRCTTTTVQEVPTQWRRTSTGAWRRFDLSTQSPSGTLYGYGCSAWGVSAVVGKGFVIVGRCQGSVAVVWLPNADGSYGAPQPLPAGASAMSATSAWAVNRYGWILGQVADVNGRQSPALWKLP